MSFFRYDPKIKICGITNEKDAMTAAELGADFLGFIFYSKSKRFMHQHKTKEIIDWVRFKRGRKAPKMVGVFVNESRVRIDDIQKFCQLDILQLSGDEPAAFCHLFHVPIWKTIHIKNEASLPQMGCYLFLPAILLDKEKEGEYGGTGESFDFNIAAKAKKIHRKIILSGGLHAGNIKEAITIAKPWAVDINSGAEKYPGKKDKKKMGKIFEITKGI